MIRTARKGWLAPAALALLCLAAPAARADLFLSDNFDGEANILNYTGFANWDVTNGSVDTYLAYADQGFGLSVDLDGTVDGPTGDAGTLSTKTLFALEPGEYTLSFRLGKNGAGTESMTVSLGGVFGEVFTDTGPIATPLLVVRTFLVTSATSGRLVFDHAGGDNRGFVLDDVRLEGTLIAAVPEPGSLALLLAGLASVGGVAWRRRARD